MSSNRLRYLSTNEENSLKNGLIYQCTPIELYTWQHNTAWLLGHIHLNHSFIVTSPLIPKFIFREDAPHLYSAWAKEIICLAKSEYHITNITSKNYIILSPSINQDSKMVNIRHLNPNDTEIAYTLKKVIKENQEGLHQQKTRSICSIL